MGTTEASGWPTGRAHREAARVRAATSRLRLTRSWAEFLGDEAEPTQDDEEGRTGWLGRLRESLAGSRRALTQDLFFDPADESSWERVEEALIQADVGVPATVEVVRRLEQREPASEAELLAGLEDVIADLVAAEGD